MFIQYYRLWASWRESFLCRSFSNRSMFAKNTKSWYFVLIYYFFSFCWFWSQFLFAVTYCQRLVGALLLHYFLPIKNLWISPCSSIHFYYFLILLLLQVSDEIYICFLLNLFSFIHLLQYDIFCFETFKLSWHSCPQSWVQFWINFCLGFLLQF